MRVVAVEHRVAEPQYHFGPIQTKVCCDRIMSGRAVSVPATVASKPTVPSFEKKGYGLTANPP
jgi:hypothetical protein